MSHLAPVQGPDGPQPTHAFPRLQGAIMNEPAEENPGALFQPLFRCASGGSAAQDEASAADDLEERVALARQCQFQQGSADGRHEAFCQARSDMTPDLRQVLDALDAADQFQQSINTLMAGQIVELALQISAHILTEPIELSPDQYDALHQPLQEHLAEHHRLQLSVDAEELEAAKQLCECLAIEWPEFSGIHIVGTETPDGVPIAEPDKTDLSALEEIIRSAFTPSRQSGDTA